MLATISAGELVARLGARLEEVRRTRPRERPILAFDADGTLWSGDVGEECFARVIERRGVRAEAAGALRELARRHGLPEHDEPHEQARVLYAAFERGVVPEREAFMFMAWMFAGYRPDEMYAFAEAVIEARGGEAAHHAELGPVLAWARDERVEVWVVSASPQAVVEQGVRRLGVPRRQVRAMRPAIAEGYLQPSVEEPVTYAEGKAQALLRAVEDGVVIGAFGDSGFDVTMFGLALQPVAVRPKPALLAHPELPASTVRLGE